MGDVPEAILEELLFQYYGGVVFVSRVVQERGWLGVNFLYRFPPVSTEQILHPEKYFDKPDVPTRITLHDLPPLFSADWEEIENNVLGELMVRALFKRFLSEEQAKVVAEGWGGDRFVAFRRGEEIAFIWATLWDSSQDAREFFQHYQEILSQKYADPAARAARTFIEQRGQRVVVVEGLETEHVKNHIEKIWQGMALEPEPFNPFFSRLRSPSSPSP